MNHKEDKPLFFSKPTPWYYALALFFPIMFFLVDDSGEIFKDWNFRNFNWILKVCGIIIFFCVPVLLILLRREIKLFEDRIEINQPAIKQQKVYYLQNLVYWQIVKIHAFRSGSQTNLTIKFNNKRLDFNKIELTAFEKLKHILETNYGEMQRK